MQCRESFLQEKNDFLKKERTQCIFGERKKSIFYVKHNFRSLKYPPDVDWIVLVIWKNNADGIWYAFKDAVSLLSPHKRHFAKTTKVKVLLLFDQPFVREKNKACVVQFHWQDFVIAVIITCFRIFGFLKRWYFYSDSCIPITTVRFIQSRLWVVVEFYSKWFFLKMDLCDHSQCREITLSIVCWPLVFTNQGILRPPYYRVAELLCFQWMHCFSTASDACQCDKIGIYMWI